MITGAQALRAKSFSVLLMRSGSASEDSGVNCHTSGRAIRSTTAMAIFATVEACMRDIRGPSVEFATRSAPIGLAGSATSSTALGNSMRSSRRPSSIGAMR
jgi:hypothetical protein